MRAMILAAGRGERLRPLTDKTPKPLIPVCGGGGGEPRSNEPPLIRHVRRLTAAGFSPLVVNLSYLGEQIRAALGDGAAFGARVFYSPEESPLGAGGGIRLAMERGLLPSPFVVVNGDIVCDYDLQKFHTARRDGAHLLLVDNPPQKSSGDFSLSGGVLRPPGDNALTYAGMGVFHPSLFTDLSAGQSHALLPTLQNAIKNGTASGEYYNGQWHDIGTADSLRRCLRQF